MGASKGDEDPKKWLSCVFHVRFDETVERYD